MHLQCVFQVQNRFIFSMFEPKNVIPCIYVTYSFQTQIQSQKPLHFFKIRTWKCHFIHLKYVFQTQIQSQKSLHISMFEPEKSFSPFQMCFQVQIRSENGFIFSIFEPKNIILCISNPLFKFKFEVKIAIFFQCTSLIMSIYAFTMRFQVQI